MIALGAAVSILGFVLPWANLSLDALLRNWLQLWGLAGAGHWLLVTALLGLGLAAAASGRPESWPVGAPALALGAVLLGLVWPYLFGGFGRPFGVIVVLVGSVVLIVGGAVRLAARHEAATPTV
jgi:hypothetical protein